MHEKTGTRIKEVDNIVRHFILAGILILDVLAKIVNLIITPRARKQATSTTNNQRKNTENELFSSKSEEELREILSGIEILSSLKKNQLIDLINARPEAIQKYKIEEKKRDLHKLRTPELRSRLKGVDKVYKLKKAELIDKIITEENLT